jgi:hypothetical protein
MGLDPTDGVGPEKQPPKIAVDAIKEGRQEGALLHTGQYNE